MPPVAAIPVMRYNGETARDAYMRPLQSCPKKGFCGRGSTKKACDVSATGFTQKRHTLYLYYNRFGRKFQRFFLYKILCISCTRSAITIGLDRKPFIPLSKALRRSSSKAFAVIARMGMPAKAGFCNSRMRRVAV